MRTGAVVHLPSECRAAGGVGGERGTAAAGVPRLALAVGRRQDDRNVPAVSEAASAQPQVRTAP
jgi:hypothetical protein